MRLPPKERRSSACKMPKKRRKKDYDKYYICKNNLSRKHPSGSRDIIVSHLLNVMDLDVSEMDFGSPNQSEI